MFGFLMIGTMKKGNATLAGGKEGKTTKKIWLSETRLPSVRDTDEFLLRTRHRGDVERFAVVSRNASERTFYFAVWQRTLAFAGRRIFTRQTCTSKLYYKDGRLNVTNPKYVPEIGTLLSELGAECIAQQALALLGDGQFPLDHALGRFLNRTVLKGLVTGRITNLETLVRKFAESSFGLRNIDWKKFFHAYPHLAEIGVCNLRDYTTDFSKVLDVFADGGPSYEAKSLFFDLLKDCMLLGTKMNPCWSFKRMTLEHGRNIRMIMDREVNTLPEEPIFNEALCIREKGYSVRLLNTAKEIYQEAREMAHCLYYNYSRRIESHGYLAFSVLGPSVRGTLGMTLGLGTVSFDQFMGPHNGPISQDDRDAVLALLEKHWRDLGRATGTDALRVSRRRSDAGWAGAAIQPPALPADADLPF